MLRSIQIKNYRTCKDLKIYLKSPLMALIGRNASGKTNTLQAIRFASQRASWGGLLEDEEVEAKAGFSAKFVFEYGNDLVTYTFRFLGEKELYIRDSFSIQKNGQKINIFSKNSNLTFTLIGQEEPVYIPPDSSALAFLIDIASSAGRKPSFVKGVMRYFNVLDYVLSQLYGVRYYSVQNEPAIRFITREGFDEWKNKGIRKDHKNLFSYQYYDFYINRRDDFEEYRSLLKSLGVVDEIGAFEYANGKKEDKISSPFIVWSFKVQGKHVFYEWLSDGTKRVLGVLFHLFYDNAALMLIEEPESSIHWGLLVNLVSIFDQYSDNKKILISTHSEQILNKLTPQQLIYLYIDEGDTKAKYVTARNLKQIEKFLKEIGPLGEYVTSGGLEEVLDD